MKLTETQARSLRNLIAAGGVVSEWAEAFKAVGFDGRTQGPLVRKGLVELNHPEDRMAWTVSVTDAGRQAV